MRNAIEDRDHWLATRLAMWRSHLHPEMYVVRESDRRRHGFRAGSAWRGLILDLNEQDLEPVLRQFIGEFETARPEARIVSQFDLPGSVRFDASRLGQLVSNLIGNAFTHGDPAVAATVHEKRLVLSVGNAGAPIPEAAMARLFQPFFRGEVRPSQQGLGLGLRIASEIARAHGGTLTATSSPAEIRFTLDMPSR